MSRQQQRAAKRKDQKRKTKTYNFTEAQLHDYVKKAIEIELIEHHEEAMNDAINTAMILMLTLPMEVLMDYYWTKKLRKKNSGIHKSCIRILRTMAKR